MLKLKIRKIAGATGAVVVGGLIVGSPSLANAALVGEVPGDRHEEAPSAALLKLEAWYDHNAPVPGMYFHIGAGSGTRDEFLRVGDTYKLSFNTRAMWRLFHRDSWAAPAIEQVKRVRVKAVATYFKAGAQVGTADMFADEIIGAGTLSEPMQVQSQAFTLPSGVDMMSLQVTPFDIGAGAAPLAATQSYTMTVGIYGSDQASKNVIFDNLGNSKRQRIVEGGAIMQGGAVTLAYTDWRSDMLVTRFGMETQIGESRSQGRFGEITIPIFGKIVHEVSYGVFFDDGGGWRAEAPLKAVMSSLLVSRSVESIPRTTHESRLALPANATRMELYFHLKTYLVVDYAGWPAEKSTFWYQQGERRLVKEVWDNRDGANTNYEFPLELNGAP